jgi:hypothetical protein
MIRGNALVNAAARGLRRSWSHCSGRSTGRSSSSSSSDDYGNPPVVELREYTLLPGGAEKYMELAEKSAPLRKSMLPLRFFGLPQTGGTLNVATHMYFYKGAVYVVVGVVVGLPFSFALSHSTTSCFTQRCPSLPPGGLKGRDDARKVAMKSTEWRQFLDDSRPFVLSQRSTLYTEASCVEDLELWGLATESLPVDESPDTIYEVCRYQLNFGATEEFIDETKTYMEDKFSQGRGGIDPSSKLCTVLQSDFGDTSASVLYVWRHGGGSRALTRTRLSIRDDFFVGNDMHEYVKDLHITQYKAAPFSTWK